jgi:hypothetical protein
MSSSQNNAGRRVQWSSTSANKFLVSGTNELRLCEYVPPPRVQAISSSSTKKRPASKTVGVCSDLPAFKVSIAAISTRHVLSMYVPIMSTTFRASLGRLILHMKISQQSAYLQVEQSSSASQKHPSTPPIQVRTLYISTSDILAHAMLSLSRKTNLISS